MRVYALWVRNTPCPGEVPGVYLQDTLETSLFALHLFPTNDGPAGSHPPPPGKADMCL